MKKKILAAMITIVMAGALAACGNKDTGKEAEGAASETEAVSESEEADEVEDVSEDGTVSETENVSEVEDDGTSELKYLTDFEAKDYVTIGEYKGVKVALEEPDLSDERMEGLLNVALTGRVDSVEVTDRSVKLGDTANIDYEGKMDGVAFEGGTAQGADLTIGSESFIAGFEDGIIGMKIGETKDIELNFPDPYLNNPDFSGKPVVFTVTVNSISVPDLTDEYVASLDSEECSTVEEFRSYMYDALREKSQADFEILKINAALEVVEANAVYGDIPKGMLNRVNDALTNNIASYASMYGLDIGDCVAYAYGGSADDYQNVLLEQARLMTQRYILMAAIADVEGIEITDAELEESIAGMTAGYTDYGYESEEAFRETIDEDAYRESLLVQEVAGFLGENAVLGGADAE